MAKKVKKPKPPKIPDRLSFAKACNLVAEHLPENWQIVVQLERHAGNVTLIDPDGEEVEYDSNHERIHYDLEDALHYALENAADHTALGDARKEVENGS